jgi:hypothetical protein
VGRREPGWPPRFSGAPRGADARTLTEIEGQDWGPPGFASHLVKTCHALRHKPLGTFTVEDLRIMIGQQISLAVLLPLALDSLEHDPLAEGDLEPGALLQSVLRVDPAFWRSQPGLHRRIVEVARRVLREAEEPVERGPGARVAPGHLVQVARGFLGG